MNTSGATTAKTIDGDVYGPSGEPVAGAEVRVEIWGGSWPDQDSLRTTQSTTTDFLGHYEVTIDANFWNPHNTIWVYATDGPYQGDIKVEADAQSGQVVDVTMTLAIPEFSNPIAIVLICAATALVFYGRAARVGKGPQADG